MGIFAIIILVLALLGVFIVYSMYAGLIRKKNNTLEALSGIDVQLKKRSNLIPNILKIAQKYMEHEKGVMEEITKLRSKSNKSYDKQDPAAIEKHLAVSGELASKMSGFMVQVENYPELKSNETMLSAMGSYNEVEAQIAAARRFYNSAVTALNNATQIFPSSAIASRINIKEMPFYKVEESANAPVNAGDFL